MALKKIQLPDGTFVEVHDYRISGISTAITEGDTNPPSGGAVKTYVDGKTSPATETDYGVVKTNPNESVTLDANGRLNVGGRLGQMPTTTGVYSPKSIAPNEIGNGSFLLTEASGTKLGNKSLAVTTGTNITLKTAAAAGSTTYQVANNYANRIICAGLVGGVIAIDEASSSTTVNVVSVTIGGSSFTPDSSADNSSNNIVIKTDASINPSNSISKIRGYAYGFSFSNLFVGQCVGGNTAGASVIVGQKVFSNSGNACALIGADIYNAGNGNAVFGRQHISKKNRWFMSGTGHDNTNGKSESGAVFGEWALISADTAFAIGNGTSQTARSNLFEIKTNGDMYLNGTKVLP